MVLLLLALGSLLLQGMNQQQRSLLAQVSAWQKQDLPRRITFANGLRAVGFGELAAYPCGGTHVASLAALGNIVISQLKMKKGQMIVSYTLE